MYNLENNCWTEIELFSQEHSLFGSSIAVCEKLFDDEGDFPKETEHSPLKKCQENIQKISPSNEPEVEINLPSESISDKMQYSAQNETNKDSLNVAHYSDLKKRIDNVSAANNENKRASLNENLLKENIKEVKTSP